MKINLEILNELQEEAMLDLSQEELENILKYENEILKKFEKVLAINTDNVMELHYPFEIQSNTLREDDETNVLSKNDILSNAPSTNGDFITITKVVK
ncbi:Asp-tRNA(Asn)/Glu-tRNA(Gln) amidotransferase subunit GatC [Spiroplasma diminutum]|uniref:Glutamyl-tRNA(Gln) amidotransferase subunit C n=1 Tax=Spiroplasma diminutum CUAS-1 TaxID=1276221 RepID=S5LZ36_9MOLU|nr:Asp-tRNA(Asn)/Glu-tRNA(Gln) amidotransferase subunit GatC [Spiroplasma diminutum]AGR41821.1 glutamyl-tRNA(Gln) amidotransferase subunit C [Spiroplasma diminutum CUAS-1]